MRPPEPLGYWHFGGQYPSAGTGTGGNLLLEGNRPRQAVDDVARRLFDGECETRYGRLADRHVPIGIWTASLLRRRYWHDGYRGDREVQSPILISLFGTVTEADAVKSTGFCPGTTLASFPGAEQKGCAVPVMLTVILTSSFPRPARAPEHVAVVPPVTHWGDPLL
jgi:hypothetical protein